MNNTYDNKLEVLYVDKAKDKIERVSLATFKALYPSELNFAYETFRVRQSVFREDWQKTTLETEFFQDLFTNFNNYTKGDVRLLGVY